MQVEIFKLEVFASLTDGFALQGTGEKAPALRRVEFIETCRIYACRGIRE